MVKRDRLKIIAEILQVAKKGAKKTRIMYVQPQLSPNYEIPHLLA
jgi:predicted transcriptional regulator